MKIIFIISTLLFGFWLKSPQKSNQELSISYMGFATNPYGRTNPILFFCIQNNSSDTIYLSSKNIKIEVKKGDSTLKEDVRNTRGSLIPPPPDDPRFNQNFCNENAIIRRKKELLIARFSKRLFAENFSEKQFNNLDKQSITEAILNLSIVILPHSKSSYQAIFNSRKFDKEYKVTAHVIHNPVFCSFEDDNGTHHIIYNKGY